MSEQIDCTQTFRSAHIAKETLGCGCRSIAFMLHYLVNGYWKNFICRMTAGGLVCVGNWCVISESLSDFVGMTNAEGWSWPLDQCRSRANRIDGMLRVRTRTCVYHQIVQRFLKGGQY
jgi:hypothetical protein